MTPKTDTKDEDASKRTSLRCRLRLFRRDRKGAAAIEFAILALPFFALIFATIETALIFLVGFGLDAATANSARLIRTGQAQQQGFDQDAFRDSICDQISVLYACESNLKIDVRTSADFGSSDLSTPIAGGELQDDEFGFDDGKGGDIVVVRAFYEWPTVTRFLGEKYSILSNGNYLITSTAAFRNEPFPW